MKEREAAVPVCSQKSLNWPSLVGLWALIVTGFFANVLHFQLFFNIDFLFGSIFALLALQCFGLWRGVAAAAIISSYTFILWNHPYACIIFTAEVAIVGWLYPRRKIGLVLADTLYWLCIGLPLAYFIYYGLLETSLEGTRIIMIKQAINGIMNTLIARLLFAVYTHFSHRQLLPLREIIATLLGFFVLIPALLFFAIDSRSDMTTLDRKIREKLQHESAVLNNTLQEWLQNRKNAIVHLATVAAVKSPQQLQPCLDHTLASDHNFLRVTQLDAGETVVAIAPLFDSQGNSNLGVNFSDRPFIPLLRKNLQPMLSEMVIARIGSPEPVVHMLAPVVTPAGYGGVVVGVLKLDRIEELLDCDVTGEGELYTLTDRNGNIISTNIEGEKAMTPRRRPPGRMLNKGGGIQLWIPNLPVNTPIIDQWERSTYLTTTTIDELSGWTLTLEIPVAPFQQQLYTIYSRKMTVLFAILLCSLLIAELLSRIVARSNEELLTTTSDLPTRLSGETPILWPTSSILETKCLIDNFRTMATTLSEQFNAIRSLNISLENRVEARTRELLESRERFDLAVRGSQDAIWDWDIRNQHVYLSERWFEMLGYTADEYEPSFALFESLIHLDDKTQVLEALRCHLEDRAPYSVEFRMRRKDGECSWILARGQALWNDAGVAIRMAGSHTDITDRKELESALRQANLLLQKTFASLNESIFIVETGTRRILDCNVTTERMFGYRREEIVGKETSCLHITEAMSQRFGREMLQAYKEKGFFETTFQMKRKDGSVFISEHSVTPIYGDSGEINCHVCVVRDISERKIIEEQILASLREKEVLLKEIHHRVKNNLQIVYSLLTLQGQSIADQSIRDFFEESRNRIGTMALIHEKIYISQDLAHINFILYLQELAHNIANTYLRPEIRLVVEGEAIFLDINCGIPCGLIVNELVSNSFKYAFPPGQAGEITINLKKEGDNYQLTVADNGIGLPEDLDFRKTTSLGLRLVTVLTGQLQGVISLDREGGTLFSISFPVQ